MVWIGEQTLFLFLEVSLIVIRSLSNDGLRNYHNNSQTAIQQEFVCLFVCLSHWHKSWDAASVCTAQRLAEIINPKAHDSSVSKIITITAQYIINRICLITYDNCKLD